MWITETWLFKEMDRQLSTERCKAFRKNKDVGRESLLIRDSIMVVKYNKIKTTHKVMHIHRNRWNGQNVSSKGSKETLYPKVV